MDTGIDVFPGRRNATLLCEIVLPAGNTDMACCGLFTNHFLGFRQGTIYRPAIRISIAK